LLDDVLVAVARSVRQWADRVLTERAHDRSALPDVREPPDPRDDDLLDEDGPPAHWVEMVRERAPHLVPPRHRRAQRSSAEETLESWSAPQEETPAETVAGAVNAEPAAMVAHDGRDESDGDREPRADRTPAIDHRARPQASVAAVPVVPERAASREGAPSPPLVPAPAATAPATPAPGPAPARRSVERDSGEAPRDARAIQRARGDTTPASTRDDVVRTSSETPDRSPLDPRSEIARGGAGGRAPRGIDRSEEARRGHDVRQRSDREPDAARSEAAERSSRRREPDAAPSKTAARSLRWYRAPEPVEDETTARSDGDGEARARSEAASTRVRRLRDPAQGRHDAANAAVQRPAQPQASLETARSEMRSRDASPARHDTAPRRRSEMLDAQATRTLRRRAAELDRRSQIAGGGDPDGSAGGAGGRAPRGIDPAPVELPRVPAPPVAAVRRASAAYEPGWDAGTHTAASPWRRVERTGSAHTFSLSSEMCAALWPRLPDEGDDASDAGLASQPRPDEGLWPELAVDELVPVEEPAHVDSGRDERLRREQRGMRWSERRS
jgi:hypothetical protein